MRSRATRNINIWLNGLISIFVMGCSNDQPRKEAIITKYSNGSTKSEKFFQEGDTIDYKEKDYYPNGRLQIEYAIKNNKLHGSSRLFYMNGSKEWEGFWYNGEKIGHFKYFDSTGHLDKIVEFLPFKDSANSRANQIIRFDVKGDTVKENSLFYEYYYVSDTIKLGDLYEFKIVLTGHIFNHAFVKFCDFDDRFNLLSEENCNTANMPNLEIHLKYKRYKLGENYLRGVIVNYNQDETSKEPKVGKYVEVYFSRRFFVVR